MNIIVAMALTILKVLFYIIETTFVLFVMGAVLVVIGLVGVAYHRWREASDRGGFFEESYVSDNGEVVLKPSKEAKELCREMDRRADNRIFQNTEEL